MVSHAAAESHGKACLERVDRPSLTSMVANMVINVVNGVVCVAFANYFHALPIEREVS